jgi:hypothetical protein
LSNQLRRTQNGLVFNYAIFILFVYLFGCIFYDWIWFAPNSTDTSLVCLTIWCWPQSVK